MFFYVYVIIPIPIDRLFTYSITKEEYELLAVGMRVAVPFGKSKIYTAIVVEIHQDPPSEYEAKPIHSILDDSPIVNELQLRFWAWVADYYMCTLSEVCKAALPGAFLIQSETYITLSEHIPNEEDIIDDEMYLVFEALQRQTQLRIDEVKDVLSKKQVLQTIYRMVDSGWVKLYEKVIEKYKPKQISFARLSPQYQAMDEAIQPLLEDLKNAPKQRELFMSYLSLQQKSNKSIEKKYLLDYAGVSSSIFKALVDKDIFEEFSIRQDRLLFSDTPQMRDIQLSEVQQQAFSEIQESFRVKDVVTFRGITASGKTEIYKKLIEGIITKGQQVLYLLPEIALTTQIIVKLRSYFGDNLVVYHSKYSIHERVEIWRKVSQRHSKAQLILGTRSAIWLPFTTLGLIIVDEEHEMSYKQSDPAPRFHARDTAIILARQTYAKVLLGSATPSIESYYNAKQNKYALVSLTEKYYKNPIAIDIQLIDLKSKSKRKQMRGYFSQDLLDEIKQTVDREEQVILYQNRRGYAPVVECQTCGHSPQCVHCDVTLTYHKMSHRLECHYCGYNISMPPRCIACGEPNLDYKGYGTEQIEAELNKYLPDITTQRLDFDTTRGKYGYEKIITDFEQQEINVLIGTQMITKGLDFEKVTLVGVMNADSMLHFQDFRAHERAFQTLRQLVGRAGRSTYKSRVLIQTYNPTQRIIQQIVSNDYQGMYLEELNQRKNFEYPPYRRLVRITLKDKDFQKIQVAAEWLGISFKNYFKENNVLGPQIPLISRIKNKHLRVILLKLPSRQSIDKSKSYIKKICKTFSAIPQYRSIRVNIDVDCY